MSNIHIVIIHFGKKVPNYIFANLRHLKKNFPKNPVILVSDNVQALQKAKRLGVKSMLYQEDKKKNNWLLSKMEFDMSFRDYYWWKTSLRILTLCEVQSELNMPVLHVESDVLLFPKFPLSKMLELEGDIAYPLFNRNQGIASLLFIRNKAGSELLYSSFRNEMIANSSMADMAILGKLSRKLSKEVSIFSTLSNKREAKTLFDLSNQNEKHYENVTRNFDILEGAVDGLQYGLYFTGEDPRNNRGIKKLFFTSYNSDLDLKNAKLRIKENSVFVFTRKTEYELFSLHLHSKELWAFNFRILKLLLRLRSWQSGFGPRNAKTSRHLVFMFNLFKHELKRRLYALTRLKEN
jgi:hypothetical protein